jgi:hypothetical protein
MINDEISLFICRGSLIYCLNHFTYMFLLRLRSRNRPLPARQSRTLPLSTANFEQAKKHRNSDLSLEPTAKKRKRLSCEEDEDDYGDNSHDAEITIALQHDEDLTSNIIYEEYNVPQPFSSGGTTTLKHSDSEDSLLELSDDIAKVTDECTDDDSSQLSEDDACSELWEGDDGTISDLSDSVADHFDFLGDFLRSDLVENPETQNRDEISIVPSDTLDDTTRTSRKSGYTKESIRKSRRCGFVTQLLWAI